ncbi:MAG: hypothetical protein SFX73_11540 [Kofleriaceae bacterium]|nr:hypothetical protein [Kofleriaceae bacterium]
MANCPVCKSRQLSTNQDRAVEMCSECAGKYGVRPMPPALRPPAPCQRCSGLEFVRTVPREHSIDHSYVDINIQKSAPMYFTPLPPQATTGFFGVKRQDVDITQGYGQLELYACLGCGFVEWYVHSPRDIPAHPHLMTEKIDYGKGGPYR